MCTSEKCLVGTYTQTQVEKKKNEKQQMIYVYDCERGNSSSNAEL